ncbi:hypothetical protein LSCM1_01740 [Leishmania martiniquensis]|uniref:Calpain catalytic domain-containing protein n=1 Tax=Leishmania martiniquensis TaxID=1580590 RepID=A0A836KE42_9TRYP|nr:hypothetical protein LSCM1_01740 [Leishmania martiniquensis]
MPSRASLGSSRTPLAVTSPTFVSSVSCPLPIWDDAQVAQENWGSSLTVPVPSGNGDGGKEAKPGLSGSKSLTGCRRGSAAEAHYEDEATHHIIEVFILSLRPPLQSDFEDREVGDAISSDEVAWRRPAEVFHPFRPIVHRNVTPFVDPYAKADALIPVDAKAEEARCQAQSSLGASITCSTASQRKGGGATRQSDTAAAAPQAFHQTYPEAVTVLDMFSQEEKELWCRCTPTESVRRYRALPTLMEPYDGVLVAGCAETPAQSCESRYSTGLRHKLKQAEQLAALKEKPPFLMRAFNSALLAVEQAQRYVPEGWYLWELVYPHAPGTCHPVYNPFGKYAVKLFIDGAYRKVLVDDYLPADVLGRPLLTTTSRKELWPCLIAKALLKALGSVSGVQALSSAPELIVAALLGNWVPQYLSPRHDTVSTTALLLLYQRQLTQLESVAEPIMKESTETSSALSGAEGIGAVAAKDANSGVRDLQGSSKAATQKRTPATGTTKSSAKRQQSSHASKGSDGAGEEAVPLEQLTATEYCEPVIDEPLPEQPIYVCGLRTPPEEALTSEAARRVAIGYGSGAQLYTIHAMKPFRNTVALLLHTTPRAGLSEGIFEKEKDADDVSALHEWSRCAVQGSLYRATSAMKSPCALEVSSTADATSAQVKAAPVTDMILMDSIRAASVTSCWLTLEEFMLLMETVIVWRKLVGRYSNAVCITGESLLQHHGYGSGAGGTGPTDSLQTAAAHKKSAAARRGEASLTAAGTVGIPTQPSNPLPPSSMWWKLTAERAVEAVVVVSCPATVEAARHETLAAKGLPATSPSPRSCQPVEVSDPLGSRRGSREAAEAHLERRVHFQHFQWGRAEPLNHIGSLTYTTGVLRSTVLYFRPGVHLIYVDAHHVQPLDRISILSDAVVEVQLDLSHDVSRNGFACLTDAGVYPAVESYDMERVWLKRVFTLTAPTCVTLQLSTVDATEDLVAQRQIHTAANRGSVAMSGGKGGGNHGKTTAGARNALQGGSAASGAAKSGMAPSAPGFTAADGKKQGEVQPAVEAKDSAVSMSILRFSSLVLVNLDHPRDCCVGTAGRLVKLQLEPNEKGYLIMAYTNVPSLRGQRIHGQDKNTSDGDVGWLLPAPLPVSTSAEEALQPLANLSSTCASVASPPLFPAGCWKLMLRSNVELQTYDTVAHDLNNVTIESDLPRGGSSVLFRRICSIAEATHVSIVADLRAPVPMPYTVRIVRLPTPAVSVPTSATPRAVRAANGNSTLPSALEPVAGDAGGGGKSVPSNSCTFLVYESPPTQYRLFVADVLLSAAVDVSAAKGGKGPVSSNVAGGGTTIYAIEAAISEDDAATWNESCRQSQEETFLQYREAAEQQVFLLREREPAGAEGNPLLLLPHRGEAWEFRRQLATEVTEKTTPRSATAGSSTTTSQKCCGSLRPQSTHLSTGIDSMSRDLFRGQSSSTRPHTGCEVTTQHDLDTMDPNWNVHISACLSFSSSRVEVKAETPAPDAALELRKHMKETVSWLQEWSEQGSHGGEFTTAAGVMSPLAATTSSSGKSSAQRGQRDAASVAATMEDALRAEAARQSRSMYLSNPQRIICPSFNPVGNADGSGTVANAPTSSHSHRGKHEANGSSSGPGAAHPAVIGGTQGARYYRKELAQTITGTLGSVLDDAQSAHSPPALMYDELATQIRYAAPLHPSQYSIELLPLRSWEECPSAANQGKDGAGGAGASAAAANSRGRRPKNSGATPVTLSAPARAHSTGPAMASNNSTRAFADMTPSALSSAAVAAASTLSCPLTAAEREKMLVHLRTPLTQATECWDLASAQARVAKSENQMLLKNSFSAYFEALAEQEAASGGMVGTAPSSGDHPLQGAKDDRLGSSRKARKSFAST